MELSFSQIIFMIVTTAIAVIYLPTFISNPTEVKNAIKESTEEKVKDAKIPPFSFHGSVDEGYEEVAEAFKKLLEEAPTSGYNYAVYHKGKIVIDLYGGYADASIDEPYRENTLTNFFSATKGISAICVAVLVDRGLLDYKQLVTHYWPEFGANGKESITVETLLSHQTGLYTIQEGWDLFDILNNPEKISKLLAEEKPAWEPGTKHGYHAFTITMYMNELIKRIDPKHRTLEQFFDEEFAKPLDLDIFIGLPLAEYYRAAKVDIPISATGLQATYKVSAESNNPHTRKVPNGSVNGFGTARDAAKLMGIIASGGEYQGKMYLSPETTKLLTDVLVYGDDAILKVPMVFGRGTSPLDPEIFVSGKPTSGNKMFGTPGYGGQFIYGDLENQFGMALLTNKMFEGWEGAPVSNLMKPTMEAIMRNAN